jgi:hypothetical protein
VFFPKLDITEWRLFVTTAKIPPGLIITFLWQTVVDIFTDGCKNGHPTA